MTQTAAPSPQRSQLRRWNSPEPLRIYGMFGLGTGAAVALVTTSGSTWSGLAVTLATLGAVSILIGVARNRSRPTPAALVMGVLAGAGAIGTSVFIWALSGLAPLEWHGFSAMAVGTLSWLTLMISISSLSRYELAAA